MIFAILVGAACGPNIIRGTGSSAIYFPQFPSSGTGMVALLEGTLEVSGRCLFIRSQSGELRLPVWSSEFTLEADQPLTVVHVPSGIRTTVGERIALGGGELALALAETYVGQIPADCQTEWYFVATSAVRP